MGRLSIHDLVLTRAGHPVLAGFSAEVEPGRALMVKGPNGSGKTSLLRALAGLLPPAAGSIRWDGADFVQDGRQGRGGIAFVGHQDGIKGGLTVRENLRFWSDLMGAGAVPQALPAMGLERLADRLVRSLSAGQRRRAALARLALGWWDLWLLDEPMTALDEAGRALALDLVRAHLLRGGIAVIAGHETLGLPGQTVQIAERGR